MEAPLLTLLDDVLRNDRGPAGFGGTICVAVKNDDCAILWSATFGDRPRGGFVDAVPRDADSLLLLGEREAESIIHEGCTPIEPETLAIAGDRALLEKFVDRYLARRSVLSVRTSIARRR